MKRVLLIVALCVTASVSFAQKKVVNEAQSIAKGSTPDFSGARTLIKGALENPETKDNAKTWYVTDFIEDQRFSNERTRQVLGQQPDEPVMYEALGSVLPYSEKAYELNQFPNEEGKVRPKFAKDIKGIPEASHVYYINGGTYHFDQKDYNKTYDFFEQYLGISDMPVFEGEAVAERDSNFMTVRFYAAVTAIQLGDFQKVIAALERAKNTNYRANEVYQYLCYECGQAKNTVNLEKTLEEGLSKFPEEQYFLMNLINNYIYSNRSRKATEYLNIAIARGSNNPQLYNVMGHVYEAGSKDYAKAEEYFKKALVINPDYIEPLSNLSRIYYSQGVNRQGEANMINDAKQYQEELDRAREFSKQALPYFEKAHQMKPEEGEYMTALRSIYYSLNMGNKFDIIEVKVSK